MTTHTHTGKTWLGKPFTFRIFPAWKDDTVLEINDKLYLRADAEKLRDMLVEVLGAPEPEPVTTKPGEAVEFVASNRYRIIDRSPFALVIQDAGGKEKYRVGKYTVAALREYFQRPYVAAEPTIQEQFAALPIGARFVFTDGPKAAEKVKVSETHYYSGVTGGLHTPVNMVGVGLVEVTE